MSESDTEQLKPPSQETLDGIWSRVSNLTEEGGFQPKGDNRKYKSLYEPDGHILNVSIINEIGERSDADGPLVIIIISGPRAEEELSYSLYKDKLSGKKRLEKNAPTPKRKLLSGDEPHGEVFAKARQLKEELMGQMEDTNIRRFRGLSAVGEPEAQELLQRLNTLKIEH